MKNNKKKFKITTEFVLKIVLVVICLGVALSVLLPMFRIEATFTDEFKKIIIDYWSKYNTDSSVNIDEFTGNNFIIHGYQFTFGHTPRSIILEYYLEELPIPLKTNVMMIIYYCIPLLIIPFIFLFNKDEKKKAIKNYILGFLTLALTVFFFVYTKNDIDNLSSILLEPSQEYNVQLYTAVDTIRYALQGFLNMLYFVAAIIFFYIPTIGKKETKRK